MRALSIARSLAETRSQCHPMPSPKPSERVFDSAWPKCCWVWVMRWN